MDLLSLVTSGVNDSEVNDPDEDILGVVEGWQDDESHNPDVPAVSHNRGMMSFVFVPFNEVHVSTAFLLEFRSSKILETPSHNGCIMHARFLLVINFNYLLDPAVN